jgi:hypothetical protein
MAGKALELGGPIRMEDDLSLGQLARLVLPELLYRSIATLLDRFRPRPSNWQRFITPAWLDRRIWNTA